MNVCSLSMLILMSIHLCICTILTPHPNIYTIIPKPLCQHPILMTVPVCSHHNSAFAHCVLHAALELRWSCAPARYVCIRTAYHARKGCVMRATQSGGPTYQLVVHDVKHCEVAESS